MLGIMVGLYAIGLGILGIARPQLLFKIRHPISVTSDSGLNESGIFLYRVGGVFSIILGLWVIFAWE